MAQQEQRIALVTGANRGIGATLAANLLARPNTIVYAGVRDIAKSEASLAELKQKAAKGSELRFVKIDSSKIEDAAAAAREVQTRTDKVDLVIANAGISIQALAASGDISVLREQLAVNTVAPVALFQAFYPLLKKSSDARFAVINTMAASSGVVKDGGMFPGVSFYGASKAAVAYYIASLSEELKEEPIIVASIHPGLVSSDMGTSALKNFGLDKDNLGPDFPFKLLTPEESAQAVLKVIDGLTKNEAGYLLSYDGGRIPF